MKFQVDTCSYSDINQTGSWSQFSTGDHSVLGSGDPYSHSVLQFSDP